MIKIKKFKLIIFGIILGLLLSNFGTSKSVLASSGEGSRIDLSITAFSASPTTISLNGTINLVATVRNNGTATSEQTTLFFYRSDDRIISTSDAPVTRRGKDVNSIPAGNSVDVRVTITGPSSAGTYYYGACIETVSGDTNTSNNCSVGRAVTVFNFRNVANVSDRGSLELDGAHSVTTAQIGANTYLFVAGANDDGVSVFRVASDDSLSNVDNVSDNATLNLRGASSVTTAQIGANTYLFVADPGFFAVGGGVSVFRVAADGRLSFVDDVSDGGKLYLNGAYSVTTSQIGSNTYLFVAGLNDSGVSVFRVAADGILSFVDDESDNSTLNLRGAASVTTSQIGANTYLFVAGRDDNGVSVFRVAADGRLSRVDDRDDGANCSNNSNNNALKLCGAISVSTAQIGANTYLFVAGRGDDGVSVFRVASDGRLTNVYNVDDDGTLNLDGAASVTTAQIGANTYLFVAGRGDAGVSIFSVASNGSLTNVTNVSDGGTLELKGAASVTTAQIGANTYLFVAGYVDDGVSVFEMDRPSNHSFSSALNIEKGNSYSGNLTTGSNDYYKVYLTAGTWIFSTQSEIDTVCELYNNSQSKITPDNSGTGNDCSITWNITTAGYYYILVKGRNNSTTGNYTLKISGTPDLVVSSFTANPTTINSGGDVNLAATVTNNGNGASNTTTLRYYRSADSTISTSDTSLDTDTVSSLSASSSSSASASVTVHSTGTMYYGACVVDVAGETNPNNNCSVGRAVTVFNFRNVANVSDNLTTLELDGAHSVTTAQIGANTYLFVAGANDDGVSVFSVASDDSLSNVANVSDNATLNLRGASSVTTAQIGANTYLFVADPGFFAVGGGVSVFRVAADGRLSFVDDVSDGGKLNLNGAYSVTTSQIGANTYLFVAVLNDSGVSVFRVAADGTLTNVDNKSDNSTLKLKGAASVTTSQIGANTYLFVAGRDDDGVSVFRVASDGTLTHVTNVSDNTTTLELDGANSVTTAQIGANTYLFVAGKLDSGVSVFRVASDGRLTNVYNVADDTTLNLNGAASVTTSQIGANTYLFVAGRGDDGVSIFSVASNGELTNVGNVSDGGTLELDGANSVTTAQIGANTYLFVAGEVDDGVSVFEMDRPTNHSFTTALNIKRNNSYSGNLTTGSNDYYKVYLTAGTWIFSTQSEIDTVCELYNNPKSPYLIQSDNDGTGNDCSITRNITTAGDYYILVKGINSSTIGNYTLKIDPLTIGASWTEAKPDDSNGWTARYDHTSIAFDNKMWVLGGSSIGFPTYRTNDVWFSVDGFDWEQVTASADWTARNNHTSIAFANKIWVLGGYNYSGLKNDVWSSSNGISWTQATDDAGWLARNGHTSVAFDNKMWVLGGLGSSHKNDVWSSENGSDWTQATDDAGWSARTDHTSIVFDNKMWVLGGHDPSNKNDVWSSSNGSDWRQVTDNAGWIARWGHTSIAFDNKIWVLGGYYGPRNNDVWSSVDGSDWTEVKPNTNNGWTARWLHTSIAFDNKIWVLGGYGGITPPFRNNDVWYSAEIPNNNFANALSLNAGSKQMTSHSAILTVGGSDYYKVHLTAGTWTFSTSGRVDTVCELYNSPQSPYLIQSDNDGTGDNCSITRNITTAGDYYILVKGKHNSTIGNYTLKIEQPTPDLVVSSFTATPTAINPSGMIDLAATVTNSGTGSAASTDLHYYRSTDNIIDTEDTRLNITDSIDPLSANSSDSKTASVTGHSSGTMYYGACVMAVTGETTTNNNCSTGVRVIAGNPDLVVSSFTASPTVIHSDGTIDLAATVRNSGIGSAAGTILRYYRSTNNTIDTADIGIGIADYIDPLSVNSSESEATTITGHSSGTMYYGACVMAVAGETTTDNNCSVAIAVTVGNPDLTITAFNATPDAINSGGTVNLEVTVTNSGDGSSASTDLHYYRSTDNIIDTADTRLNITDYIATLSANSSDSKTASVTGHISGTMYYWACVVPIAGETTTDNNCSVAIAVTVGNPDLTITSFNATPDAINSGGTVNLEVAVTNSGIVSSSTTDLHYYRSTDNIIDTADTRLNITDYIATLSVNSSENKNASVTGHISGTMYYGACVVSISGESDPNNNCSTTGVAVRVLPADLEITNFSANPDTIDLGDSINLSATVTNSGTGLAAGTTLRYYRSTDSTIDTTDNYLNITNYISPLTANNTKIETATITGHSSGTMYYGACVMAVAGETNTTNNCSSGVAVSIIGSDWTETTASADWTARREHTSIVFDNKIWVLGGLGSSHKNDIWSSSNGSSWTEVKPNDNNGWTARRIYTSIVFDNKIWVLGGYANGSNKNDVWSSSNGISWTQATDDAGWLARNGHTSVAFDNKMWVLGGLGSSHKNDVWSSENGSDWTQATDDAGWSARAYHTSIVFDNKMWVLGGYDPSNKNDVWSSSNGSDWRQVTDNAGWIARWGHTSIAFDNKMWVLGGYDPSNKNDVWSSSNGTSWTQATNDAGWSTRWNHTSIAFDSKMWVLGGGGSLTNDVWSSGINNNSFEGALSLNAGSKQMTSHSAILTAGENDYYQINLTAGTWTFSTQSEIDTVCELYNNPKSPYLIQSDNDGTGDNCSITWNITTAGDYYILVKGINSSTIGNYTLKIDPPTIGASWTEAKPDDSNGWTARYNHTSIAFDNKIWVLGGSHNGFVSPHKNDIWSSSNGSSWTEVKPNDNNGWTIRSSHTSLVFDNKIWVLGGYNYSGRKNDIWSSSNGSSWTEVKPNDNNGWTIRASHTSLVFDNKMWVLGGNDGNLKNDVWSSENGSDWTQATDDAGWSARDSHISIVFDNKMWVLGGYDPYNKNDVWSSSNGSDWRQVTDNAGWIARWGHTSIAFDNKMWVLGGYYGRRSNDVWSSVDGSDWTEVKPNTNNGWTARLLHTSIAFDNKIWMLGGFDSIAPYRNNDVWYSAEIPNNNFANALSLNAGSKQMTSHSAILTVGGSDYYKVHLTAGTWTFSTQSGINTTCELYNSPQSPYLIQSDNDGTGDNCSITRNITTAGDYYILVKGKHNSTTGNYTLKIEQPTPDLVISSFTATPTAINPSGMIDLAATVTNSGTGSAASTDLHYYRSTDNIIDTEDTRLNITDSIDPLSANSSDSKTASVTGHSSGTMYYGACVMAVTGETTTNNNCSTGVRVIAGNPDLVVSSFTASPTVIHSDGTIDLRATVTNNGTVSSNPTALRYHRSRNNTRSDSGTLITTGSVFSISASNSSNETASTTGHSSGTMYYWACVVANYNESNTSNNCSSSVAVSIIGSDWQQSTALADWDARYNHTSIAFDNKMWVLGGNIGFPTYRTNDVWFSVDGFDWEQATDDAGWSARQRHTSIVFDNKMWVLGGFGSSHKNDVWSSSNGISWTQATDDAGWLARSGHTSVAFDNKMWVLGGNDGSHKNDVWSSENGSDWTQATDDAGWLAREEHTSIVFDNKMWVLGGYGYDLSNKNDVWSSSNGSDWRQVTDNAGWIARWGHTSIAFDNKMWVLGGYDPSNKNDVWSSVDGSDWTEVKPNTNNGWTARWLHTSIVFDNKIWMLGGSDSIAPFRNNDVWYSAEIPNNNFANALSLNAGSKQMTSHSAILTVGGSDYYKVHLTAGTWTFSTQSGINTTCELYDSLQNKITPDSSGTLNNCSITFTINTAGDYYILVKGRNNFTRGNYTLKIEQPTPDLVISSFTATPTAINPSGMIDLAATVTNSGTGSAASTDLHYYRSTDNIIDTEDTRLNITDSIDPLSANSSDSKTASVTGHSSGTMYYGACVMAVTGETTTNNNCSTGVRVIAGNPDLVVSSFTASPTVIHSDGTIDLAATVRNSGIGSAAGTILRYYRSTNNTIDTADIGIGIADYIDPLSVNSSESEATTITGHSSGTMYYGACVMAVAGETTTDNNCSVAIAVTVGNPDLTITAFNATPDAINSGGTVNLEVTVTNSGDGSSASTDLHYYRSIDNIIDTADTRLNITDYIATLSANSSESEATTITGHSSGTMYYGACVMAVAGETNTTNNCSIGVRVIVGNSDLVVSSFTANPTKINPDVTIDLRATVTNSGTGLAAGTTLRYYRSTDSTIDTTDNYLNITNYISPLTANNTKIETATITGHSSGTMYYGACVMAVAGETNTTNNCSSGVAVSIIGSDWTETTASADWTARLEHTSIVFDNKIWVLGGLGSSHKNDIWSSSNGSSWTEVKPNDNNGWTARRIYTSIVFDNKIWVLGGYANGSNKNDVWSSSNGISWTQATDDAGWLARNGHTSVAFDNKMWVLGGLGSSHKNDVWSSENGSDWTQATDDAGWSARAYHTSIVFDNKMWVLGGFLRKNDVWSSSNGSDWSRATSSAGWTARYGHTSIVFDNKVWVLGGGDGSYKNDVWSSVDGSDWTEVKPNTNNGWTARLWHTSIAFDNKIWMLGGSDSIAPYRNNDVWYSAEIPNNNFANALSLNAGSKQMTSHSAILTVGGSDYYKVHLTAGTWTFSTSGRVDTVCELYNSPQSPYLIQSDNDGTGDNCSITRNITTAGDYYILVKGKHNSTTGNYTLKISGTPDLVVSSFTATPTVINSNGTINLAANVTNNGNGVSNSTTLRYYRSTSNTVSDSGTPIATNNVSSLSAGSSDNKSNIVTVHTSGTMYYWACVVPIAGETNTTNNCSIGVRVIVGNSDLVVSSFTANPTKINPDGTIDLRATVTNNGTVSSNPTALRYHRSRNNTRSDSGTLITTGSVFSISASNSSNETASTTGHSSGTMYYWACVVANYNESNTSNNCSSSVAVSIIGSDWQQSTALADWDARYNHTSIAFDNKMWVLGGNIGFPTYRTNDVWFSVDGFDWEQATDDAGWSARQRHTSIVFDNKMWVLGGYDGSNGSPRKNDVWSSSNGISWTQATDDAGWLARSGHTSVAFDNKMWVLGGNDGSHKNDVWSSENGSDWTQATDDAGWLAREEHTSIVFDNKMWVLGGYGYDLSNKNDVWSSSNGSDWRQVTDNAGWIARWGHTSIAFDNKMWVLGGYDPSNKNDVWSSVDGSDWTEVKPNTNNGWTARWLHTSIVFDNKIWMLGGSDSIAPFRNNDVWYSAEFPNNNFANALSLNAGSKQMTSHSAILTVGGSDYYKVHLTAGTWTFSTSGRVDTVCELYNSPQSPYLIQSDNDGTLNNCSITYNITTAGDYYIQVFGYSNTTGNYTLDFSKAP